MTQINYEELASENKLKDHVKRFWKLTNLTTDTHHSTILPDGYFDLIISLTLSIWRQNNNEQLIINLALATGRWEC